MAELDRRRLIKGAAVAGGAVWAAPTIVGATAAAATSHITTVPPPELAVLAVTLTTTCNSVPASDADVVPDTSGAMPPPPNVFDVTGCIVPGTADVLLELVVYEIDEFGDRHTAPLPSPQGVTDATGCFNFGGFSVTEPPFPAGDRLEFVVTAVEDPDDPKLSGSAFVDVVSDCGLL